MDKPSTNRWRRLTTANGLADRQKIVEANFFQPWPTCGDRRPEIAFRAWKNDIPLERP
jgi:hypothetical protein